MNILFYSYYFPTTTYGGVEHVTDTLCVALQNNYHHRCFVVYFDDRIQPVPTEYITNHVNRTDEVGFIRKFIIDNSIDIVIAQGIPHMAHVCRQAVHDTRVKIAYVFHTAPNNPYSTWSVDYILDVAKYRRTISYGIRRLIKFPLRKVKLRYEQYIYYRDILNNIDTCVFLSPRNKEYFFRYSFKNVDSISSVIFNPLSFPEQNIETILPHKEKRVLVVARFDEYTKRLLWVLRIWRILQCEYGLNDWQLDILGSGSDDDYYREYMRQYQVPNIKFWGRQDPRPFYEKASIYMMTSRSEALPMVLLEAMQYGCVPIAFDSFPAVRDVITNAFNGYLIRYHDTRAYARKIVSLTNDTSLRHTIAHNAMNSLGKYRLSAIVDQWQEFLLKTMNS